MAKKTARPAAAKPSQQRTKEDQWRRRMAQQSQVGAGSAVAENSTAEGAQVYPDGGGQAGGTGRGGSTSSVRRGTGTASAVTQRANMAARGTRMRLNANTLPLTEEMHYITRDIRKLIVLTVICLVILIALSFIVPMLVK